MSSWRDNLSDTASHDVETLLSACLRLSKEKLSASSEFRPFALVVDLQGKTLATDIDLSGLGKRPDAQQIAEATITQLQSIGFTTRCSAMAVNTRLSEKKTDAVEVRIEHKEGSALLVLQPYKRPRFGGQIDFDALMMFPTGREIWAEGLV